MKKILVLLFGLFLVQFANGQNKSATAPVMKFVEETHDFGTIKEGPEATYDFWFTNTGQEPLIIRNCSASCGCTTPDWTKAPIPPGQKGKISVKYTSEGHPGSFNKTVYIASNAASDKERVEIYIKGVVIGKEKISSANRTIATPVKPVAQPLKK
jgi:hypothetical protein